MSEESTEFFADNFPKEIIGIVRERLIKSFESKIAFVKIFPRRDAVRFLHSFDNRIFQLSLGTDGNLERLAEAKSRLEESTEFFANVCQTASLVLLRERLIKSFEDTKSLFVK